MSFQYDTTPKARKNYRCYMCGEQISIGTTHKKWAGVYEGDFHSDRAHLECIEAVKNWDVDEWEYFEPHSLVHGKNEYK
jgi:hypothetical protein